MNGGTTTMVRRTVSLALTWGSQTRNNCPACQRFVGSGDRVECRGCGAVYIRIPDTDLYEAEADS